MVTDTIGDLINHLKTANRAGKSMVSVPYSGHRLAVVELLAKEKYVVSANRRGKKVRKYIDIELAYDGKSPRIHGARRISRPSRRLYRAARELRPTLGAHRIMVLSTPKGILTDREAKKQSVGGEVMFEIW